MSRITAEEIKKLAVLARLPLTEAEIASAQKDMEEILEYVGKLGSLDTSGVPEVHGGGAQTNALRADEAAPISREERNDLIKCLPNEEADMAKVPPVLAREK